MPRLKQPNAKRQRSLKACVHCRRRKEKCDGQDPCIECRKRGLKCTFRAYSADKHDNANLSSPSSAPRKDSTPQAQNSRKRSAAETANDEEETANQEENNVTAMDAVNIGADEKPLEAPVLRSARLLRDGHGKFIYIGDSASLSFVQNVRRIVTVKLGECDFTNDVFRHSFLEQSASMALDGLTHYTPDSPPIPYIASFEESEMLVSQYLTATSSILEVYDEGELRREFQAWIAEYSPVEDPNACMYYLIIAIGAQAVNKTGYDMVADRCFSSARQMIPTFGTEEPSIQTIICYLLITMYLLGACRRNAAYMNLGVALRAAYALGLNRADLYKLFPEPDRQSRERIWRSLRIMDLFLSTSLGRPPSTSDFVGYRTSEDSATGSGFSTRERDMSIALAGLGPIFEKILSAVYKNQEVSTRVAYDISLTYHEWTKTLPQLPDNSTGHQVEASFAVGAAHLLGSYHWSIMLLTRPFLLFEISSDSRHSESEISRSKSGREVRSVMMFADSCVDSALRSLDIAENLLQYDNLPRRLPFILNTVFNAALVIGVAYFGNYDLRLPLNEAMEKAEEVLNYMKIHDPQAERCDQIVSHLARAARSYVGQREQMSTIKRRDAKRSLFGDVGPNPTNFGGGGEGRRFSDKSLAKAAAEAAEKSTAFQSSSYPGPAMLEPPTEAGLPLSSIASWAQPNMFQNPESLLYPTKSATNTIPRDQESSATFSSDSPGYQFTIPTFGLLDDIESDVFGNFLIPSFPQSR